MKTVIVMPTCKRPEMLALALEAISRTTLTPDDIRIFADTNSNISEVEYVRDNFVPHALMFHAKQHADVPSGMWNILSSIKQGYETGADRVFLIEEDIIVGRDFFSWHLSQNAGHFALCGRRMLHLPNYGEYTNPGSSFPRWALKHIVPHINDRMFADRRAYFDRHFGKMDEVSDLDDGMIRRIMRVSGFTPKYPDMPKCAHIGFRGYNHYMNWVNEGNIEERIEGLRKMLPTIDRSCKFTGDFEPLV